MKALVLVSLLSVVPAAAHAQADVLPSLWNCVGDTRVTCAESACLAAPVVGTVQVSFQGWRYERCAEVCTSGIFTAWREDSYGSVFAIASDAPQHLILRPGNRFQDVASDRDHTVITEGRCYPALQSERTPLSTLEVYDAFVARSPPPEPR